MNQKTQNVNSNLKPKKRNRKDLHPKFREHLGMILKGKRMEENLSLNDIELMSDMSKAMSWSVEMGKAKGIDYYIEYANTVCLNLFSDQQTNAKPKYELPEKNKNRIFLTARIRELKDEEGLFESDTTVQDIITLLEEKKGIQKAKGLSTKIAGILRNWIEEDGILTKRKKGNINIYRIRR